MSETIGPRLSDAKFFSKIDATRPRARGDPRGCRPRRLRHCPASLRRGGAAVASAGALLARAARVSRRAFHEGRRDGRTGSRADTHRRVDLLQHPAQVRGGSGLVQQPHFNQYKEWTWQLSRHPNGDPGDATAPPATSAMPRRSCATSGAGAPGAGARKRRRRRDPVLAHHRGGHPHGRRLAVGAAQLLSFAALHR